MPSAGPRIKQCRKAAKMSVAELARRSGIAPTTLYDLERGESRSTTKLHRIAAVLQVNVTWLETGKGNPETSGMPTEATTLHGIAISEAGAHVGAEWDKLREPLRTQIQQLIETLVAGQKRGERRKAAAIDVSQPANNHNA